MDQNNSWIENPSRHTLLRELSKSFFYLIDEFAWNVSIKLLKQRSIGQDKLGNGKGSDHEQEDGSERNHVSDALNNHSDEVSGGLEDS